MWAHKTIKLRERERKRGRRSRIKSGERERLWSFKGAKEMKETDEERGDRKREMISHLGSMKNS